MEVSASQDSGGVDRDHVKSVDWDPVACENWRLVITCG